MQTWLANYLRALPLHHLQKEKERNDVYLLFSKYIKPSFDFRQEILWIEESVEVLSPASLRETIKTVHAESLKLYE
ncbi:MAG: WYL domain-containing protein [Paludibacter sp.]